MTQTLIISTKELESLLYNNVMDKLGTGLSGFNASQLNMLIQKHQSSYCLAVCLEFCYYQCTDKEKYSRQSYEYTKAIADCHSDFSTFITRFLNWDAVKVNDYLEWIKNILCNTFMQRLVDLCGVDIYDHRQFELRSFGKSLERSTPSERVLALEIGRKEVRNSGDALAV